MEFQIIKYAFLLVTVLLSGCTILSGDITKHASEIEPGEQFSLKSRVLIGPDEISASALRAWEPSRHVDKRFITNELPKETVISFQCIWSSGGIDPVVRTIGVVESGELIGKTINIAFMFKHNDDFVYYPRSEWLQHLTSQSTSRLRRRTQKICAGY